jgi:hypothetical protein
MTTVVFDSLADFTAFKADFPRTLADPDTLLGEPAFESVDAEGQPLQGSRVLISHHFTAEECAILQMAGAEVRVGGVDGPIFGEEPTD